MKGRVGVFGGTFNPPHRGHIRVAQRAFDQYSLSKVLFVPSGVPPHKIVACGVTPLQRYEMVRRAIQGHPGFDVSRIEIDRAGPSYTVDTIRELSRHYPEGMCFIAGADLVLDIESWKEPQALLTEVPFVLAPRHGIGNEAFSSPTFRGAGLFFLDMEEVDLSSRWLRARIARGEGFSEWVPAEVAVFIREHRLYRTNGAA
ncbi:nicotinate (nicotinamide) nucleotide adenylyltransferase [Candidatus Bipolaricaulota bacterium]|nr:nicotinate (nicotinamide) nucleotide adenylyltransferase [Candidatus Bipolaricaulota bacterium]